MGVAGVDVGRQALDSAAPHVLDEQRQLVGLRHVEAHRGGVEFGAVMRLQPGGLVGDQRVAGGVALVEAVAGELVDRVEQLVGLGRGNVVVLRAALDKARTLRVHLRLDLLAHRPAQQGRPRRASNRRAAAPPASPAPGRRKCRRSRRGCLRAAGADIRSAPGRSCGRRTSGCCPSAPGDRARPAR